MKFARSHPSGVFSRVVCCVDMSAESIDAVGQAALLAPPEASFVLVSVANPATVMEATVEAASWGASVPLPDHSAETVGALTRAEAALLGRDSELRVLRGAVIPALLEQIERERATLTALGIHGYSRWGGIVVGRVATALLHAAPSSVLVARRPRQQLPRALTVGLDGSKPALQALQVAVDLAERLGCALTAVVATGGGQVNIDGVRAQVEAYAPQAMLAVDRRRPEDALIESEADLLVLGNRRLRGIRALGSVSETVAHHARQSVLVVRPPGGTA